MTDIVSPFEIVEYLNKSWDSNRDRSIKWLFHLRSINAGLGYKKLFRDGITWLAYNHPKDLKDVLVFIPSFGSWRDLLYLLHTPLANSVIKLFANTLIIDKLVLGINCINGYHGMYDYTSPCNVTMAAKWCPSAGSKYDKKYNFCSKLCSIMRINKEKLRKDYLTPIRRALNIVETKMCNGEWNRINYTTVPIGAMKRYKNVFIKKDRRRFLQYAKQVNKQSHNLLPVVVDNCYEAILSWNPSSTFRYYSYEPTQYEISDKQLFNTSIIVNCSGSCVGIPMSVGAGLILSTGLDTWIPLSSMLSAVDTEKDSTNLIHDMMTRRCNVNTSISSIINIAKITERIIVITDIKPELVLTDYHEIHSIPDRKHIIWWNVNMNSFMIEQRDTGFIYVTGYDQSFFNALHEKEDVNVLDNYVEYVTNGDRYQILKK